MASRRALSQLARLATARRGSSAEAIRCISSSSPSSSSCSTSSLTSSSTSSSTSSDSFETALAVATCGNGDHGRLGHGGVSSLARFTLVAGGGLDETSSSSFSTRPVAVAAGGAHTLILTADGAVLSFGLNDAGQLGHSEGAGYVTVPMEALVPEEIVHIAAGDRHSLAVGASGRVWAWGSGGGAGAGPGEDSSSFPAARLPRLVPGISSARSVAAGSAHSLILCRDGDGDDGEISKGTVYSWGDGSRGALGHGEGSASATGSGFFSFFFSGSKKRKSQRGRAAAERAAPRLLRTLAGRDARAIAASGSRSGAILRGEGGSGSGNGGEVFLWGDDGGFRAAVSGAGRAALDTPARVPGLDSSFSISLLALGRSHALCAREGGGGPLLAWGDGSDHGALGLFPDSGQSPSASPPVPPPTAVDRPCRVAALDGAGALKSISAGWKHSLACCEVSPESAFGPNSSKPSSSLFSWGWGGSQGSEGPLDPSGASTGGGQLGSGDDLDRPRPYPVSELVFSRRSKRNHDGNDVSESSRSLRRWRALQVSAGLNHSAALVEVALG